MLSALRHSDFVVRHSFVIGHSSLSILTRDLLGIAATVAAFAVLAGGIAVSRRRTDAHPELSRKFLHVGMGCVVLSFPWLFTRGRPWPVLLMGAAFLLLYFTRQAFKNHAFGRRLSGLTDVLD